VTRNPFLALSDHMSEMAMRVRGGDRKNSGGPTGAWIPSTLTYIRQAVS